MFIQRKEVSMLYIRGVFGKYIEPFITKLHDLLLYIIRPRKVWNMHLQNHQLEVSLELHTSVKKMTNILFFVNNKFYVKFKHWQWLYSLLQLLIIALILNILHNEEHLKGTFSNYFVTLLLQLASYMILLLLLLETRLSIYTIPLVKVTLRVGQCTILYTVIKHDMS